MNDRNRNKEGKNKAGIYQTQSSSCQGAMGMCTIAVFSCRYIMISRFTTHLTDWKWSQPSSCLLTSSTGAETPTAESLVKNQTILALVNSYPLYHCSGETRWQQPYVKFFCSERHRYPDSAAQLGGIMAHVLWEVPQGTCWSRLPETTVEDVHYTWHFFHMRSRLISSVTLRLQARGCDQGIWPWECLWRWL